MSDPIELLSPKNTNKANLLEYIRDTCDYCTDYQLPELDFAINHHGEPDVALFDFTSMFAASNSSYVKEKNGKQILLTLVGDGLLEVNKYIIHMLHRLKINEFVWIYKCNSLTLCFTIFSHFGLLVQVQLEDFLAL